MPLVQQITGSGATLTLTGVAAGNALILLDSYFRHPGTGVGETAPTDTQGTWSVAAAGIPGLDGDESGSGIFYQLNVAAGTHTVTPQANTSHNTTLIEWSGMPTSGAFDVGNNAATNASSFTSQVTGTTSSTAQADEVVFIVLGLAAAAGVTDVGFTDPVSGFTTVQKVSNDASDIATFHAYKVVSAIGTQSATFNWTDAENPQSAGANIAAFKITASASPAAYEDAPLEDSSDDDTAWWAEQAFAQTQLAGRVHNDDWDWSGEDTVDDDWWAESNYPNLSAPALVILAYQDDWTGEDHLEDDAWGVEAEFQNASVAAVPQVVADDWAWDEDIGDEVPEASGPVDSGDMPWADEWWDDDAGEDATDASQPVIADALPAQQYEDTAALFDDDLEASFDYMVDDFSNFDAPVIYEADWDWNEDQGDDVVFAIVDDDDDAVGANAPPLPQEDIDWSADDQMPVAPIADDYQQSDALPVQAYEHDWDWAEDPDEGVFETDAAIGANVVVVPQQTQEEIDWTDEVGAALVPDDYQQSDAPASFIAPETDIDWSSDEWPLTGFSTDYLQSDVAVVGPVQDLGTPELDIDVEVEDDFFDDFGNEDAPDLPPEDGWDWRSDDGADDADLFVIIDDDDDAIQSNAPVGVPTYPDEWNWDEDVGESEIFTIVDDDDDAIQTDVPAQVYADDWQWDEDAGDDIIFSIVDDDDDAVGPDAPADAPAEDAPTFEVDLDEYIIDDYGNFDAPSLPAQPYADEWFDDDLTDDWLALVDDDDDAVGPDAPADVPSQDVPDFDGEVEDWAPIDEVLSADPAPPQSPTDDWTWEDDTYDIEYGLDADPVGPDLVVAASQLPYADEWGTWDEDVGDSEIFPIIDDDDDAIGPDAPSQAISGDEWQWDEDTGDADLFALIDDDDDAIQTDAGQAQASDDWNWDEDAADADVIDEPVGQDAPACADHEWIWSDEADDDGWWITGEPLTADLLPTLTYAEAWDWNGEDTVDDDWWTESSYASVDSPFCYGNDEVWHVDYRGRVWLVKRRPRVTVVDEH